MNNNDFVFWLKGFVRACDSEIPSENQWSFIKEELLKLSDDKNEVNDFVIPDINNILLTDKVPNPYFLSRSGTSHSDSRNKLYTVTI